MKAIHVNAISELSIAAAVITLILCIWSCDMKKMEYSHQREMAGCGGQDAD